MVVSLDQKFQREYITRSTSILVKICAIYIHDLFLPDLQAKSRLGVHGCWIPEMS